MADKADGSVVLAQLQVAFLWDVKIRDWVHVVGHSPVFQILLQIVVRMSIMASPPAWTNSAGMLSIPADFPIFSALTAASTSSNYSKRLSDTWWLLSMRLRTRLGHGQYPFLCKAHRRSTEIQANQIVGYWSWIIQACVSVSFQWKFLREPSKNRNLSIYDLEL